MFCEYNSYLNTSVMVVLYHVGVLQNIVVALKHKTKQTHVCMTGCSQTIACFQVIIEHPDYIAGAERCRRTQKDPFFRTDEKSQFSPDITPLILAAHYNNHEMIQMFLSRNHTIERPHPIACQCSDCVTKQNYDSLKRSRSRLNAYRALASPAYMALSSPDPIMTTFKLRQEMKLLAQVEKEFKVSRPVPSLV